MKSASIILAVCLTLVAVAAGCRQTVSNTGGVNTTIRNGSATEINSGTNPLSAPASTPAPDSSPKTVQVRLTHVETNADLIDSPIRNSKLTIRAGETSFDKATNSEGVALFDAIPCGGEVSISLHDEVSGEDAEFRRKLECDKTSSDLGVITTPFGGKPIFEQRKVEFIQYDPIKEVWLSNGREVPGETIERILSRYQ